MLFDKLKRPPRDPGKIWLHYTSEQHVDHLNLDGDDTGVTQWRVTARCGRGRNSLVGSLTFAVVDLNECKDFSLDWDNSLHSMASAVFNLEEGGLVEDLSEDMSFGDRVLLCDRAELEPAWQGFGIGPMLAGMAIRYLSGGVAVVACVPDPIGVNDRPDAEVQAIRGKVVNAWTSIGFEAFKQDVFVLDLENKRPRELMSEARRTVLERWSDDYKRFPDAYKP